jgi:histidine ammonia-lyase
LRQIVNNVEQILALELLAAAQGIDLRRKALGSGAKLGQGTRPAYQLIRDRVPFVEEDTILYPYVKAVRDMIASGKLVEVVNKEVRDNWELG